MTKTITYHSNAHAHPTNNRVIWWYNLPPEGRKLQPGVKIEFRLADYKPGITGIYTIVYEGVWRDRIKAATKTKKHGYEYTDVKIWRYRNSPNYVIYFGRVTDGEYQINETEFGGRHPTAMPEAVPPARAAAGGEAGKQASG